LQNERWPGFACVVRPASHGPDVTALHASGHSEMASTKAWSSGSSLSDAINKDCRWASRAKLRERTSGTQIWIGLRPRRRSRCR
jgi:hypothetical protein